MGARSAGNPYAACDVAGAANEARSRGLPARESLTLLTSGDGKRGVGHRPQATAPILDSTGTDLPPKLRRLPREAKIASGTLGLRHADLARR
jgi:hypothetical protein